MFKSAIIGSGFIGAVHAAAISRIDECKLVAVADINETAGEKVAADFNCMFYTDAEEMLKKEDIDIIHICLPSYLHEEYVQLSAKYKKHVLCEKPFSLTVDSAKRMADLCEKADVKLMVAQTVRWWPEFMELKKRYDRGEFGEIHMAYSSRLAQHPNWSTWHRDPQKSGGSLFDLNMHNLDFLYHLFGPVASVYAVGWKSPSGCWNHVCASLIFKNGVKAIDEGTNEITNEYPFTASFRMTGEKATFDHKFTAGFNIENLNAASAQTVLFTKDDKPQPLQIEGMDAYEAQTRAFIDCVKNNKPAPIPPSESVDVMRIVAAIEQSLESGEVVVL